MRSTKEQRELFIRHVSRMIGMAIEAVDRDLGRIDSTEVARRVARTLWQETDVKGHKSVSDWVKHVRMTTGKSQTKFAEALDTTQVTVARWESGKVIPSKPHRKAIRALAASHFIYEDDDSW